MENGFGIAFNTRINAGRGKKYSFVVEATQEGDKTFQIKISGKGDIETIYEALRETAKYIEEETQ